MIKLTTKFIIIVVMLVTLTLPLSTQTQNSYLVVGIDGDTITFYQGTPDGNLRPMTNLSANFQLGQETINEANIWFIPNYHHLNLSENQDQVAFTAQRGSIANLFVLDVSNGLIVEQTLPSVALLPNWSPDGTAVLLTPPFPFVGYDDNSVNLETYVYDTDTTTLHQITDSPEVLEIDFIWVDSSTLAFNGRDNIYKISYLGDVAEAITDFARDQLPICNLTFSDTTQRIYFITGCGQNQQDQALYSTDVNGDSQIESLLSSWYPEGTISFRVVSISALEEGIYLGIDSQSLTREWIVLHHPYVGEIVFVIVDETEQELTEAVFSNLTSSMALIGDEQIAVYNRQNGELISSQIAPGLVCNFQWITDIQAIYNVESVACSSLISNPIAIQSLNIVTESTDDTIQRGIASISNDTEMQILIPNR